MGIAVSAFFAFHFKPFAAGDAADIFSGVQCIAVVARDQIGSARFSPRYPIPLVRYRPEKEIERQSHERCEERDKQDTDHLEAEAIGPIDDVFGHPDDSNYPEENKENHNDIYPERDTAGSEQGSQAP